MSGRYGWKPSLPDLRDEKADVTGLSILPEVDPRSSFPSPYDQGALGSCTANAVAGAIQRDAQLDQAGDWGVPSRLFIYYGERELEGTVKSDSGARGRDGFKVAKHTGVPPETDWPYDVSRFAEQPSQQAYDDAAIHKISSYAHVPRDVDSWRRVLSNNQTIAFGFTVYESFESNEVAASGIVPMPARGERVLGGHEVLAIGYLSDHPDHVLCRNSWGTGWGDGGYFLFPWQYAMGNLASDFRTIPR